MLAAPAIVEDVPIILRGLGAVTAFNTVAVKSRVGGMAPRMRAMSASGNEKIT